MNLIDSYILKSIKAYRRVNSIIPRGIFVHGCRFNPTCSVYTYQAVERYGTIKGLILGLKRILRCNPFSKGGEDPVR